MTAKWVVALYNIYKIYLEDIQLILLINVVREDEKAYDSKNEIYRQTYRFVHPHTVYILEVLLFSMETKKDAI